MKAASRNVLYQRSQMLLQTLLNNTTFASIESKQMIGVALSRPRRKVFPFTKIRLSQAKKIMKEKKNHR